MPEIQEYLPTVQAQEPVGGVSPNIELAGAVGRSMQNLGQTIEQSGEIFHRRAVDSERSKIYERTADKREQVLDAIHQGVQSGNLNEEQIKDMLDKAYDGLDEGISTPEGRNYLRRQHSRLRSSALAKLSSGMSIVAANDAVTEYQNSLGKEIGSVYKDPGAFEDVYNGFIDHINQLEGFKGNDKLKDRAIKDAGRQLARSAVDGLAKTNPWAAQHMMDKGAYDQWIPDANERRQIYSEIEHQKYAREVDLERAERIKKLQQNTRMNKWMEDNRDQFFSGGMRKEQFDMAEKNGDITWEQRVHLTEVQHRLNQMKEENNHQATFDGIQRILDPSRPDSIKTEYDLMLEPNIPLAAKKELNSLLQMPEEMRASFMQQWKAAHGMLYTNPITTFKEGYDKAAQYTMDLITNFNKADEQGKKDLLDPNSKDFWGNRAQIYRTPPNEQLAQVANDRYKKALRYRESNENPNNEPPPAQAVRPDEINDPTKFLARTMPGFPKKDPVMYDKLPQPKHPKVDTAPPGAQAPRSYEKSERAANDDINYAIDQMASLMDFVGQHAEQFYKVPKYENKEGLFDWLKRIKKQVQSD